MKAILSALLLALALVSPAIAQVVEHPILEQYTLGVGQNSDGVITAHHDKYFGGGTARATVTFLDRSLRQNPDGTTGVLVLHVSRFVPAGTITFALLVFGIDVRGFDAEGTEVYKQELPGFTFGDSASGRYTKILRGLPLSISRLEITFRGNYE
jgi:hypothetical protein